MLRAIYEKRFADNDGWMLNNSPKKKTYCDRLPFECMFSQLSETILIFFYIISTKLMAGKLNRSSFLQIVISLTVYEFGKQHKIKSFRTAESD